MEGSAQGILQVERLQEVVHIEWIGKLFDE